MLKMVSLTDRRAGATYAGVLPLGLRVNMECRCPWDRVQTGPTELPPTGFPAKHRVLPCTGESSSANRLGSSSFKELLPSSRARSLQKKRRKSHYLKGYNILEMHIYVNFKIFMIIIGRFRGKY